MSSKLRKLRPRDKINWQEYNRLVDRVEMLSKIRGSGGVKVSKTPFGVIVNAAPATAGITTGITKMAVCAENAPHQNRIIASINDTATGVTATEGDDFEVSIYCLIANGLHLDLASPRLRLNDEIEVSKHLFISGESTVTRWTADGFQGTRAFTPRS